MRWKGRTMSLLLGSKSQRKSAHKSQGIWNHFFALHRRWPSPSRINAFMLFLRQEGYVFISVSVFCLLINSITERKNYTQPIFSYSAERRHVGHVLEGYAGSMGLLLDTAILCTGGYIIFGVCFILTVLRHQRAWRRWALYTQGRPI